MQFYFNIKDALVGNLPMVGHLIQFFSYVTIETNLLIALVLTSSWAWPQAEQYLTKSSVTSALVVYIVVAAQGHFAMGQSRLVARLPGFLLFLQHGARGHSWRLSLSIQRRRAPRACAGLDERNHFFAVIFTVGLIVTAIDHALNSDNRGPSGLGRAAEL